MFINVVFISLITLIKFDLPQGGLEKEFKIGHRRLGAPCRMPAGLGKRFG